MLGFPRLFRHNRVWSNNLIANSGFDSDTIWTKGDVAVTIAGGVAVFTACPGGASKLYQAIGVSNIALMGRYKFECMVALSAGALQFAINGSPTLTLPSCPTAFTGLYAAEFVMTVVGPNGNVGFTTAGTVTGTVDNVRMIRIG